MILHYDDGINTPVEQKIKSLKENVQLALNELSGNSDRLYRSLLEAFGTETDAISASFASTAEKLEAEAKDLSNSVADALRRLSALEHIANDIEQIQEDIETINTTIGTIQADYVALERRVQALEDAQTPADQASSARLSQLNINKDGDLNE